MGRLAIAGAALAIAGATPAEGQTCFTRAQCQALAAKAKPVARQARPAVKQPRYRARKAVVRPNRVRGNPVQTVPVEMPAPVPAPAPAPKLFDPDADRINLAHADVAQVENAYAPIRPALVRTISMPPLPARAEVSREGRLDALHTDGGKRAVLIVAVASFAGLVAFTAYRLRAPSQSLGSTFDERYEPRPVAGSIFRAAARLADAVGSAASGQPAETSGGRFGQRPPSSKRRHLGSARARAA